MLWSRVPSPHLHLASPWQVSGAYGNELVRLLGANIAPTGELGCRFGPLGTNGVGGAIVPATFISSGEMRCLSAPIWEVRARLLGF